ncbi:MAG: AmmeMemoRadiSam system protein A, partial [Planctomycetes bacterium RBG_16_43_13]
MLTKDNRSELLSIAKESITGFVTNHTIPKFEIKSAPLKTPSGVFVTIHKNGELRGCIGYSEPIKPLWEAVRDTAISAAVNDPRFEPVDKSELPELEIEIS